MASVIVGRAPCPECGFGAAHVKRSEKCLYRHCPECGSQYIAKGPRLEALLMEKTRQSDSASPSATKTSDKAPPTAAPSASAPATATPATDTAPAVTPPPPAPAKRSALFGI
jgi:hypothetical protein